MDEIKGPSEKNAEYGGYISKLILNNKMEIEINKNDIVIFVGPNNAGKSQSLKDIFELCNTKTNTTVVKDLEIVKYKSNVEELLCEISTINDYGNYKDYSGLDYSFNSYSLMGYNDEKYYGSARSLFVAYLSTLNRLTISDPAPSIIRRTQKTHPIHYVAFETKYREWLSNNFKRAFGEEVVPHLQYGNIIPLCIGDAVKFHEDFANEQLRQEKYADLLDTYKQVQEQGDGIKSFTGILLYLMLDYYCTFLIDEPESFLHPPQANIMGRIIGETLKENQQAFISTHSEEIIKGLLDVCPERIKIIRITRDEDENSFSVLENDRFNEIWNDPLLKHSNIMESLFHKEVVLCESDSDCKMYSVIESHLRQKEGKFSETFFIHCSGKHRMARIAEALIALNIQIKLIPDLDIMNDENIFKKIVETFGVDWESVCKYYKIIDSNLHSHKEKINRNEFKKTVLMILDNSSKQELSKQEIKNLNSELRLESKWENLKKNGISALPSGDATVAFEELNKILKQEGIFMVPVGQLECFIKQVGDHGPKWVNTVLEKYPDLDNSVYDKIKDFIKLVCGLNETYI